MDSVATEFTPYLSLIGGVTIGLGAGILLLANGKVAGISGIIKGSLLNKPHDLIWRLSFLLGLVLGGVPFSLWMPQSTALSDSPALWVAMLSGLMVGLGTGIGRGCTSGHGICGLARLSKRSFIATISFMLSGFVSMYFFRHVLGWA